MWYGRHSPGSSLRGRYLPGNIPPSSWSCAAAAKSLQSCLTLCNPIDVSFWWPGPWDSPGKNTGVGCHFLLQCMTVKSESEVAQSCPTLRDPMDYSPPGSSAHGIFQARVLEWGATAFSDALVYNFAPSHTGNSRGDSSLRDSIT